MSAEAASRRIAEPGPLPWEPGATPLMLAPMQGITNRALRSLYIERVRPEVVFTEFMRIARDSRRVLTATDRAEAAAGCSVPLVVQLIGPASDNLVAAALAAQEQGARHLNLNMGCPFGRLSSSLSGGGMLKAPEVLPKLLKDLRQAVSGSFSVKLRAGFSDPRQVFDLLPLLEEAGVDFLILHPRTVAQKYQGAADHRLTAELVRATSLPVIANGDITTAARGLEVLRETGAAGLMLGRGAIADPWLFERLRGRAPAQPTREQRLAELSAFLLELQQRYRALFCGDTQILYKLKEVLAFTGTEPALKEPVARLRRAKNLELFLDQARQLEHA